MLHLLDEGLETFLRAAVPLPARQVDVAFDAPDSEWGAGVTKPTVNLYLWDVRPNILERQSGMELVRDPDGTMRRRPPAPRLDCRYLVTAWTSEVADEHRLLGAVLAALLRSPLVGEEHLPESYRAIRPLPTITITRPDGQGNVDVWSALGGQLKPGLDLLVTATMDETLTYEAGPPVERYEVLLADRRDPARASQTRMVGGRAEGAPGARVRSPRGTSVTGEDGDFLVRAEEGDEVVVESDPPRTGTVAATGSVAVGEGRQRGRKR